MSIRTLHIPEFQPKPSELEKHCRYWKQINKDLGSVSSVTYEAARLINLADRRPLKTLNEPSETLSAVGEKLFQYYLPNPVQAELLRARTTGERLRLVFHASPQQASVGLPWELLKYPETEDGYLALENRISLVRSTRPIRDLTENKTDADVFARLKIFVLGINPDSASPRVNMEADFHQAVFKPLSGRFIIGHAFRPRMGKGWQFRSEELKNILNKSTTIFHLGAHGYGSKIQFADENGDELYVSGSMLAKELSVSTKLRAVVLVSCGAAGYVAESGGFDSFCTQLSDGTEIPWILASRTTLSSSAVRSFFPSFYSALKEGRGFEEAVISGRNALWDNNKDWTFASMVTYVKSGVQGDMCFNTTRSFPQIVDVSIFFLQMMWTIVRRASTRMRTPLLGMVATAIVVTFGFFVVNLPNVHDLASTPSPVPMVMPANAAELCNQWKPADADEFSKFESLCPMEAAQYHVQRSEQVPQITRNVELSIAQPSWFPVDAMLDEFQPVLTDGNWDLFSDVPIGNHTLSIIAGDSCDFAVCPGSACPDWCVLTERLIDVTEGINPLRLDIAPLSPIPRTIEELCRWWQPKDLEDFGQFRKMCPAQALAQNKLEVVLRAEHERTLRRMTQQFNWLHTAPGSWPGCKWRPAGNWLHRERH